VTTGCKNPTSPANPGVDNRQLGPRLLGTNKQVFFFNTFFSSTDEYLSFFKYHRIQQRRAARPASALLHRTRDMLLGLQVLLQVGVGGCLYRLLNLLFKDRQGYYYRGSDPLSRYICTTLLGSMGLSHWQTLLHGIYSLCTLHNYVATHCRLIDDAFRS
jgi:hypothetical protein